MEAEKYHESNAFKDSLKQKAEALKLYYSEFKSLSSNAAPNNFEELPKGLKEKIFILINQNQVIENTIAG